MALEEADCLLFQLEVPTEVSLEAARSAKRCGVPVVWDPAPPDTMPLEAYTLLDVVIPNQHEASVLTGVEVSDIDSAIIAAAVVKLGEMGAYFASAESRGHVDTCTVDVVDTVGGGDAFAGALVTLAEGSSLEDAVRYGVTAGTLAVAKPGAQDAMLTRAEVESLISGSECA